MTLSIQDIYTDAETHLDKYALMIDGTLRPLSQVELDVRGIVNSVNLGTPMPKDDRDALGYYVKSSVSAVDQTARDAAESAAGAAARNAHAISDIRIGGQRIADAGGM